MSIDQAAYKQAVRRRGIHPDESICHDCGRLIAETYRQLANKNDLADVLPIIERKPEIHHGGFRRRDGSFSQTYTREVTYSDDEVFALVEAIRKLEDQ